MSRLGVFSEWRGGIVRGAVAAPPDQNILELIEDLNPISHWRLNEASGSTFADRFVVSNMTATGTPQRLTPAALVDNDISSMVIALNGSSQFLTAPNPGSKPYDVTAGAMGVFVQPDTSTPTRQRVIGRAGVVAGGMSIEYLNGGQVRGVRFDGAGTERSVTSSIGVAAAGDACLLLLSWGAAGLKLYRNGTPLGTVAIADWAVNASLNSPIVLGIDTITAANHLDAIVSHAFFLGSQPTDQQVATLAHAASIAWAEDIDAGDVEPEATANISLKTAGAHFKAPIVPTIDDQGDLGTASVNSETIDYEAAAITGFNDVFQYHFASANGAVSQSRNITIDVVDADAPFPLTVPNSVGWAQTTRGNYGSPSHTDPIENALNVADGATLFTQPTEGLRPTWDDQTADVALFRSDGTQYWTRNTALSPPGLIVAGVVYDAGLSAAHYISGARSTQTPGGTAQEDAWALGRAASGTARGVVAASGGIAQADASLTLAEKALIVMRVTSGGELTVWRNGFQSVTQTIGGTRIASDAEQALLARYFNNAITSIMDGALFCFKQYSVAPSLAVERQLIEYFQDEFWPSDTPPGAADLSGPSVAQESVVDFDVIAALQAASVDTTGVSVVSIHQQPGSSGVTVAVLNSTTVRITVAAGATLGPADFFVCINKAV